MSHKHKTDPNTNPDPITHAPGAHPVGAGVGAAVGGAAGIGGAVATGAALGSPAGPAGTVAGAAIGAVAGGLIGKGIAEDINPSVEEKYWRDNYATRPYVPPGASYDEFAPAYRYGWEGRSRFGGKKFIDVQDQVQTDWDKVKGASRLKWDQAKHAIRDAWNRVTPKNKK